MKGRGVAVGEGKTKVRRENEARQQHEKRSQEQKKSNNKTGAGNREMTTWGKRADRGN
ncbi:hypothetical protein BCR44DRAFT_1430602 [Catenaria anguillulae PL171]|uniref:Uncharacterized protein n=1 Tax=Catenaria anguillulae PL171 TaxID=765915 RepID=A0A1Y2HST1_9FUNG|nr:hypothetical protein BCR44DRAFT_1430602 [Catenaria anguillulae PL171]